ncbi:MAG: hypothetical protein IT179_07745 [Acidobacteria bacterium]|nr:hypothetical protein [Acidobacteriota bacterium]
MPGIRLGLACLAALANPAEPEAWRHLRAQAAGSRYTAIMQLRVARLCLDCEDVHDDYRCPVCASDQFTYLTRWVPLPERRQRPRPAPAPTGDLDAFRRLLHEGPEPRKGRFLARALVGLGAAGVVGLFLGGRRARSADDGDAGSGDE